MTAIRRVGLGLLIASTLALAAAGCDSPTPSNTNNRGPGSSYPTRKHPVVVTPSTNATPGTGQSSGGSRSP